jgi:hypothetical protein
MKKPTNKELRVLRDFCWQYALNYSDVGSRREVTNMLVRHVLDGTMTIQRHPDGRRFRMIPNVNSPIQGNA